MSKAKIDIKYVAKLARVQLSEVEEKKLSVQMNDILGYFEKLNSIDVKDIQPMAHAQKVQNVWREGDIAGSVLPKELLEEMAPESRDGQVVVPKVVE